MLHIEFEHAFADAAEKFGIAKLCREQGKEYDLQSMMLALSSKVCKSSDDWKGCQGVNDFTPCPLPPEMI